MAGGASAHHGCRQLVQRLELMQHVGETHQGTLLVEGKQSYTFTLANGHKVKGHDLIEGTRWQWRQSPWEPGVYYVRLRVTSPTYGQVTIVIVDEPGQDRFYLLCLETTLSAPQLIRRWRRRTWIEFVFRTLKHLPGPRPVRCTVRTPRASALAPDGELCLILHIACDLQRVSDHGGNYL